MPAAEEQDSSPLPPLENQEGTAGDHTNTPPPVEGAIGDNLSLHLDASSHNQQPTHPVIEEHATITDPIDVVMHEITDPIDVVMHDEPKGNDPDLLYRIRGLYRLLDLINEQGSGGAGMIKSPYSTLSRLKLPLFPSGQGHHRSRVSGEACERHLPGCLHLRVKGD